MSFAKNFLARLAAKQVAKELKLEDGKMEDNKKWYKSKTILSGIVAVLVAVYNAVGANLPPELGWNLPAIPEWVFAFLGALGVYGRLKADTKIG